VTLVVLAFVAASCGGARSEAIGLERSVAATSTSTSVVPESSSLPEATVPATTRPASVDASPVSAITVAAGLPDVGPERELTRGVGQPADYTARLTGDGSPIFGGDFADPFVLEIDDIYYAYATNTFGANVPLMAALSGESGRYLGDVLPDLPAWSEPGHVWAPSVSSVGDDYVLWYSTRDSASGRQCISVASADHPAGPFLDDSIEPLICDLAEGGSIDPSPFLDSDGSRWLLWKSEGNCCGLATVIYSQQLTADGLGVAGDPVELIRNDLWWERDVVEGPSMAQGPGGYHLLYSANRWDTDAYSVGHAACESVTGPCVKDPEPWLASYDGAWGPGGPEFVVNSDGWVGLVVYHAWTADGVGYPDGARGLFVSSLRLDQGVLIAPSFKG